MDQLPHRCELLSIFGTYNYPSDKISVSRHQEAALIFQILSLGNARKRNDSMHHIRNHYRSVTDFSAGLQPRRCLSDRSLD
jgi:hypothetical protein